MKKTIKKVLLTGASYGLGRSALDYLIDQGVEVVAIARNVAHLQHLASDKVMIQSVDLAQLEDDEADKLVAGCDTIWHCAALSAPWGDTGVFFSINADATETLACAAGRAQTNTFVHISTPSIYFDYNHHHGITENYLSERLANDYAKSKYAAESSIYAAAAHYTDTLYVMLRPRAIFGPHDRVLIPRLLALHKAGKGVLKLPRGGQTLMDLTYVDNVIEAMRLASTHQNLDTASAYNITNQEPWTLEQVLQVLFAALGEDVRIKHVPYGVAKWVAIFSEQWASFSKKEPKLTKYGIGALAFDMVLDNTRAQQSLGYHPIVNMQEGIKRTALAFKHEKTN